MKKLNQFMSFDWAAFAKDKRFLCTGGGEWVDYATKEHRGTKIEVVIAVDNTEYRHAEGEVGAIVSRSSPSRFRMISTFRSIST